MFSFSAKGSFSNTESFLKSMGKLPIVSIMEKNAIMGQAALERATPVDSGLASHSWGYTVQGSQGSYSITWTNSDVENGFPVAIMIQYGHGTGTGGYVQGRDYINPAMRPVFDHIVEQLWRAVTSA